MIFCTIFGPWKHEHQGCSLLNFPLSNYLGIKYCICYGIIYYHYNAEMHRNLTCDVYTQSSYIDWHKREANLWLTTREHPGQGITIITYI